MVPRPRLGGSSGKGIWEGFLQEGRNLLKGGGAGGGNRERRRRSQRDEQSPGVSKVTDVSKLVSQEDKGEGWGWGVGVIERRKLGRWASMFPREEEPSKPTRVWALS